MQLRSDLLTLWFPVLGPFFVIAPKRLTFHFQVRWESEAKSHLAGFQFGRCAKSHLPALEDVLAKLVWLADHSGCFLL